MIKTAEKTKVAVAQAISANQLPQLSRRARLGRTAGVLLAAGFALHGPVVNAVEDASSAVTQKFDQLIPGGPTHADKVKEEIDKAITNPDEAPKGKYVWYTVGDKENPTTIADTLAPGDGQDHAEIYDEALAQRDANGFIQPGPLLVEVDHITSNDETLQNQLEQFNE